MQQNGNRIDKFIMFFARKQKTFSIKSKLKLTNLIYWVPTLIMSKITLKDITFTFSFFFSVVPIINQGTH